MGEAAAADASSSDLRLLIDIIDWGYPAERVPFKPAVWDMRDNGHMQKLILGFGSGIFNELRAVGASAAALDALRGLASGVGSCSRIDLTKAQRERLWFYVQGDECWRQGDAPNAAHILLDPVPRPGMFPA